MTKEEMTEHMSRLRDNEEIFVFDENLRRRRIRNVDIHRASSCEEGRQIELHIDLASPEEDG